MCTARHTPPKPSEWPQSPTLRASEHGKSELRLICHNFCVFSVALPLALATISPALPAASVASSAAIAVCFSPEEDCAAFAVRAIDNAESEILVNAYGLTTGSGIVEALVRARARGVDVRLIADKSTPCGQASGIEALAKASISVWIDAQARLAHTKTIIIDKTVTLTGSSPRTNPFRSRLIFIWSCGDLHKRLGAPCVAFRMETNRSHPAGEPISRGEFRVNRREGP